MEVVYANCFGAPERDLLITDEPGVARAARGNCATVLADARTEALVAKYAQTRNPAFRPAESAGARALAALAAASVNVLSRARGRGPLRVLVVDYHPTAAFARVYRARGGGPFGLVRLRFG